MDLFFGCHRFEMPYRSFAVCSFAALLAATCLAIKKLMYSLRTSKRQLRCSTLLFRGSLHGLGRLILPLRAWPA